MCCLLKHSLAILVWKTSLIYDKEFKRWGKQTTKTYIKSSLKPWYLVDGNAAFIENDCLEIPSKRKLEMFHNAMIANALFIYLKDMKALMNLCPHTAYYSS